MGHQERPQSYLLTHPPQDPWLLQMIREWRERLYPHSFRPCLMPEALPGALPEALEWAEEVELNPGSDLCYFSNGTSKPLFPRL